MTNSTLEMTHQEWLADRRKGIGGSDVATILGLNKWKSPYQLWLEKTDQITLDDNAGEAAYWGTALEPLVANRFSEVTGKKVRRRNQVFEHTDYPFLRANIDRDIVGEPAVLECKTANQFLAKEWEKDEMPMQYICQVQHYMNVLNREYAYFAVLIGGQRFIWKRIDRDQDLINAITERLVEFWEENVLKGIPPEIDGSDATSAFIRNQYAEPGENEIELPKRIDDLTQLKAEYKQDMKDIDEKCKQIDNQIILLLKDKNASVGYSPSFVYTYKPNIQRRFQQKILSEKYPEVASDPDLYKEIKTKPILRAKEI
ncbi:YqaJ viral recombinase family nuclease [Enterococcus dispar]|uniref:YqaJ viral recombinase family nuclease n=1 Tax=Enterococcus dispar TaxID=44009 RepID=UPI00288C79AF|nr:YqaJ viral recombinase family protein [Enterococcus dispar]MDT2704780.1 YqaJ viral recombinase family protein [Enterococcus dispar]